MRDGEIVAGIDEVGRGALAGPVVAAACVLLRPITKLRTTPPRWKPRLMKGRNCLIADSKLLSPEMRESSYGWLLENCEYGIGSSSVDVINRVGIVRATNLAMEEALRNLCVTLTPSLLLVDGRDKFRFAIPHRSIIKGDQLEPAIAAASIIAKVTRDRLMTETEKTMPQFRFSLHKGYGTPIHIAELKAHGPTNFHRKIFVRTALNFPQEPVTDALPLFFSEE